MTNEKLYEAIGDISDNKIKEAKQVRKAKQPIWLKWGAMAACLCLVVGLAIPIVFHQTAETPHDTMDPGDGPSSLVVNETSYIISSYLAVTDELPDGFIQTGEADVGGFEDCPYFTNPDVPEWIYVYQEVMTDGTVDASGTLKRTDPHNAYVRYVDVRLRGKDLVCYNDEYYISMWSAEHYGNFPDVSSEYYNTMKSTYGIRIEGDALEGFVSAGIAEFSGYDTIPRGALASNEGAYEVYVNPSNPDVILVATQWNTAQVGENGETNHSGFNVYIRYDCPFRAETETISFHDKTFNKSDLSEETVEWLEWYNGLSEKEQLAINYIPADLYELCEYPTAEDIEVTEVPAE